MEKLIKLLITICFLNTLVFAYEPQKGKIDMHGGKGDSLSSKGGFSGNLKSLGTISKDNKEDKDFIKIDKKEKIEKIEEINKKDD